MRMRILILVTIAVMLCSCGETRIPEPGSVFGEGEWSSGLDMLFLWSNAISLLMIAICIAIIIWAPLPGLKTWAYVGITIAGILLGCGIAFAVMKPFIPWIVLGLVGVMLLIGFWFLVANFSLLKKVIHLDKDEYKDNLSTNQLKIVEQCQPPK